MLLGPSYPTGRPQPSLVAEASTVPTPQQPGAAGSSGQPDATGPASPPGAGQGGQAKSAGQGGAAAPRKQARLTAPVGPATGQPTPPGGLLDRRKARARAAAGDPDQPATFRSPVAPLVWWVWVAFAAANLIDIAVQSRGHGGALYGSILILATGVAYTTAFKPRMIADKEQLTIRNPLRDWQVPWNAVERVALGDSLEVFCEWRDGIRSQNRKLYAWAIHTPRRSRARAEMRARRQLRQQERRSTSFGKLPPEVKEAMGKTEAEHILAAVQNRAVRARKVAIAQAGPVGIWDWTAIAALVLPALLVLLAALL